MYSFQKYYCFKLLNVICWQIKLLYFPMRILCVSKCVFSPLLCFACAPNRPTTHTPPCLPPLLADPRKVSTEDAYSSCGSLLASMLSSVFCSARSNGRFLSNPSVAVLPKQNELLSPMMFIRRFPWVSWEQNRTGFSEKVAVVCCCCSSFHRSLSWQPTVLRIVRLG